MYKVRWAWRKGEKERGRTANEYEREKRSRAVHRGGLSSCARRGGKGEKKGRQASDRRLWKKKRRGERDRGSTVSTRVCSLVTGCARIKRKEKKKKKEKKGKVRWR